MLKDKTDKMLACLNSVILGKKELILEAVTALLAGGHILLEDAPGVGKTTLATALSRVMDLSCKRVQFTPDVMPSDLTGFSIFKKDSEKFVYQEGAVFCNILLADEINRTSPKTQSALLEVMEEHQVSVEGVTRQVPDPFWVIATQNPYGTGTQKLPVPQMDRFIASMSLGYPDFESELEIAKNASQHKRTDDIEPVLNKEDIIKIRDDIEKIYIDDSILKYIVQLAAATRSSKYIEMGASPRGTIALAKLTKAAVWLDGRTFATPIDVSKQYIYAIQHRLILSTEAKTSGMTRKDILSDILETVPKPLPQGAK